MTITEFIFLFIDFKRNFVKGFSLNSGIINSNIGPTSSAQIFNFELRSFEYKIIQLIIIKKNKKIV